MCVTHCDLSTADAFVLNALARDEPLVGKPAAVKGYWYTVGTVGVPETAVIRFVNMGLLAAEPLTGKTLGATVTHRITQEGKNRLAAFHKRHPPRRGRGGG